MEIEKFLSVVNFYRTHCILKQKERTCWINWNVSGRRESIAEHISSAQALAWALYSEFDEFSEYNIEHVIALLSVHEEAESKIGDITPYQGITPEEKAKIEREAFVSICEKLKRGDKILALFDEFEAKETPEAQLAYLCDKLDCDLQAFLYSFEERCSIENATYKIVSNPDIQEIIKNGAQSVWDVFYETDKNKYKGTLLEDFFNFLKDVSL